MISKNLVSSEKNFLVNYKKFDAVPQLTGGQKPSESLC